MELQVGVKVLLKNDEGKILLLKRAPSYRTAGSWDIVGGRIDPGSGLMENLAREIQEETGLVLTDEPKLIAAQDIMFEKHVVRLTYIGTTNGEPVLDPEEHRDYKWVTFAELEETESLDTYVQILIQEGALTEDSWN
jgi:8-oxo-dGTP diphosphatase